MRFLSSKYTKMRLWPGWPHCGSLQHSPDPLAAGGEGLTVPLHKTPPQGLEFSNFSPSPKEVVHPWSTDKHTKTGRHFHLQNTLQHLHNLTRTMRMQFIFTNFHIVTSKKNDLVTKQHKLHSENSVHRNITAISKWYLKMPSSDNR